MVEENEAAVEEARGDDYVGIDGPEGDFEAAGEDAAPTLGLAAGVLVADEESGLSFFEEGFKGVVGRAAKDETYAALGGIGGNVAQSLGHEVVMAEVGVGIVGDDREVDDDGEGEEVGGFNGEVEGGVIEDALGALHPVDDGEAIFTGRTGAADLDAGVGSEMVQRGRGLKRIGHAVVLWSS